MNGSHSDTRRALFGSNVDNLCCLDGYTNPFERDNMEILSKSSEFLHVACSLKSATSSSGKVLLSSVNRVLAVAQCVFKNDDRTQLMPTQSGVNIETILSSTCIISTGPAADVLVPLLIHSVAFVLLRFRNCLMAVVAEWYRYRIVACLVTSSSPVPLKTRRVGQRCTLNLSRAETSSR
ncbi:hypothetical protein TNCV_2542661 [Trichonephila clavipes]|nr:hypothetical protein TNCV_2542661 [Trichonephila clavipes]